MRTPFRTCDAAGKAEYFCQPCDRYRPESDFYRGAIDRRFRRCRSCQLQANRAGHRRRRSVRASCILQNLRTAHRRHRSRAEQQQQQRRDLLEAADVERILATWQNRSALSHSEAPLRSTLTLALLDPGAEVAPENLVPVTVEEARRHALRKLDAAQLEELHMQARHARAALLGTVQA